MNFIQNISTTIPQDAYNDAIVEFKEPNAVKARIEVYGFDFFEISGLNGYFYFNFKEVFKILINQNLFSDKLQIVDGFNEDATLFKKPIVNFKTYDQLNNVLASQTFGYKILKSVVQIEDEPQLQNILHEKWDDEFYFEVFEGYPFDITLYQNINPFTLSINTKVLEWVVIQNPDPNEPSEISQQEVTKTFTATSGNTGSERVIRFGLINKNGELMQQADEANKLILVPGKTSDLIISSNETVLASGKIKYQSKCAGLYLKWFNVNSGWNHFLFTDKFKITPKDKSLGEVYTGFDNIQNLSSFTSQLGKQITVTYSINQDFLDERQFNMISKIMFSPKVYLWTGKKWIEVVIDSKVKYGSKLPKGKIEFDLTLPERVTQSI